ncbi:MAG TPA: flagellin [Terriglobales bacterium]|nr:flagellin [Candidatus Acidoferrum sp.]HWQ50705.1 flagellin [Terriglobales bacterium]
MRINNNITALNTFNKYTKNTEASSKAMEKLSSGFRINRAADDAAGLSISEKMRSQIAGLDQSGRNVEDGISYIQTAEGALEEVSDMLVRMKELAVEASNGTYSGTDLENIQAEIDQLANAINEVSTTTKFNGINVFSSDTTISYGANAGESVTVAEASDFTDLAAKNGVAGATADGALVAIDVETAAAAAVTTIEGAIDIVNTQRATYGAQQNKLTHISNNLSTTNENISAAESNIRDVDMASEMSEYTKDNILVQAATAMLAQANAMPQNVLSLLQ